MLHIHTYLLYTHLCICIYEVVLQMYMLYCIYMKTNKRERENLTQSWRWFKGITASHNRYGQTST